MTVQEFLFDREDRASVRSLEVNGETLIIAKDVCRVLGIKNHHQALQRLDKEEITKIQMSTAGGIQRMSAMTENGLYHLVFISRTAKAKILKERLTSALISKCSFDILQKKS